MTNYPQELAQDTVCQSHTGHMTGLWFLPTPLLSLNTNEWINELYHIIHCIVSSTKPYHLIMDWWREPKHVVT